MNTLYYGDNLEVLRGKIKDESVDLVALPKKRAAPLPLVPFTCQRCGQTIMLAPSVLARGRKYCSTRCYAVSKDKSIFSTCVGCCQEMRVRPSNSAKRYCSMECLKRHKKHRITCEVCGQQRAVTPTVKNQGARFCSWKCARKALDAPHPIMTCIQCGRERAVHPYRIRNGMKFCSQSCRSIHNLTHGAMASPTTIEIMLYKALEALNIVFVSQHPMPQAGTVPDAFVPALNLVLYADGDYWHSIPKTRARDERQNIRLAELGYTVRRLSEADLRKDALELVRQAVESA